jgi:hypothetical protein
LKNILHYLQKNIYKKKKKKKNIYKNYPIKFS